MTHFTLLILACLSVWVISQLPLVIAFVRQLRSAQSDLRKSLLHNARSFDPETLPKAAIVLCLRGADPFLSKCIEALLNQNYPNYELQIVVDSITDPAWETLKQILPDPPLIPVHISILKSPRLTCGLKCSALLQALSELPDDCEVVAFVDADTLTHSTWLQELVLPLADPTVGLTTGNRWYMPIGTQWGSIARYLWNVAASMQMYLYQIPWGGSFAFRRERFEQANLQETWGNALTDDVVLYPLMRSLGLQIKFVPSLMMINRETCSLTSFLRWMRRQLLLAKLYHPAWWAMVVHSLFAAILLIGLCAGIFAALLAGQAQIGLWLTLGFTIYIACLGCLIGWIDLNVRQLVQTRSEPVPPLSGIAMIKTLVGIPIVQILGAVVILSTLLIKQVEWRGIVYQVKGAWAIRLLNYCSYDSLNQPINTKESL
ncbi:glycosyltransferase [Leptolyngbya sp. AN03gr2]|uniref:glycosyltransferase n=1 Tax=unclassified Leptolyngbya TaxID=2650499 RepID=UPI003D31975B